MIFSRKDKLSNLGKIIKQQRVMKALTVSQLSAMSGVSASHLGRIERGERFPSARILLKIAKPLGLSESELFTYADYLSPQSSTAENEASVGRLDPYVSSVLASEPVEVQRTLIGILTILKSIAKAEE